MKKIKLIFILTILFSGCVAKEQNFVNIDYSRTDLLPIMAIEVDGREVDIWKIGSEELTKQGYVTLDSLLSHFNFRNAGVNAIAFLKERFKLDFELSGFQIHTLESNKLENIEINTKRNDWIIIVVLVNKEKNYTESVPFLPDGQRIPSSNDLK